MFCFDGADARAMAALGFRLCSVSSDQTLLRERGAGGIGGGAGGRIVRASQTREIDLDIIGLTV